MASLKRALGDAVVGQVVDGKYRIRRVLGMGGFGLVAEADWEVAGGAFQTVAIKLIETAEADASQFDELRAAVNLSHSSLLRCYTVGDATIELTGQKIPVLFVVMELASETLDDRLRRGLLGVHECIEVGLQVAKGLDYLRTQKRVHRDIKPSNILNCGGVWKIGDFGLVKELADGRTVDMDATGTLRYCPPEAWAKKLSTTWDVWSLGATLLESLTNQFPYAASTPFEWIQRVKRDHPDIPIGLPEPFDSVIRGCLVRDRTKRLSPSGIITALSKEPKAGKRSLGVVNIRVAPSGADFRTLREAVQHAPTGARIVLSQGTYTGGVTLNRPVELVGDGAVADVVVDGGAQAAIRISSSDVRIRGLTLRASDSADSGVRAVLEVSSGACDIDLCEVQADSRDGIYVAGSGSQPAFRRIRVLAGGRHGVLFDSDAEGVFEGCVVIGSKIAGLVISDKANPIVRRCTIDAPSRRGILVTENGRGLVERCRVAGGQDSAVELAKGSETIFRRTVFGLGGEPVVDARSGAKAMFLDCSAGRGRVIDWVLSRGHQVKRIG